MHLNVRDSAQKKFWRQFFLKILTFYLVKRKPLGLTRRVKKIDLAPHSMLCLTSKYEEKFYFRSIETIFVPRWGLKRLLGPQKPFLALIFEIEASISEFFTVFVAAKGAKCIPIHSGHK